MMVCTLCGGDCRETVKDFGQRSFSLVSCRHCGGTCDKYVEFELALVAFDLVLHRVEAYRHVIFNRIPFFPSGLPGVVVGMLLGLLAVDTLRGTHVDLGAVIEGTATLRAAEVRGLAAYFLRAGCEFAAYNAALVFGVNLYLHLARRGACLALHYLTVVLVVSSFGKYLYLLTIVWPYTEEAVHAIDLFALTSNIVALQAFLNCRVGVAALLVLLAFGLRYAFVAAVLPLGR